MSESTWTPVVEPAPAPPPKPPSRVITALCTVLVAAWAAWVFLPLQSRTAHLQFPELSLERIVARGLDVREAVRRAPRWERALYLFPLKDDDTLDEALSWYQRLARDVDSPGVQLRKLILLAESGSAHGAVGRVFANALARAEEDLGTRLAAWLTAAYLDPPPEPPAGRVMIAEIRDILTRGWFADTLVARIAERVGDVDTRIAARSAITARGAILLRRLRVMTVTSLLIIAVGALAIVLLWRRRRDITISDAPLPPIWPLADGFGLFVRGVFAYLAISAITAYLLPQGTPHFGLATAVATLPVLWLVSWYAHARGYSLRHVFGLVALGGRQRLVLVTLGLLGLSLVGGAVIDVSGALMGVEEDWTDFVQEDLLWGSRWRALSDTADSSIWVPFVEEIAFRGLLFSSLYGSLGAVPAAGVSGAVFAGGHGYGVMGLLAVFWSGILWAGAYARTRSLLPCIIAHGIENLLATLSFALLYRW